MKEIVLYNGMIAFVDEKDWDFVSQHKWYHEKGKITHYAVRKAKKEDGRIQYIAMHIDLLGKKEGYCIDHVNGNGLDNRRSNLRHVTHRQNMQNLHIKKSSRYPGVTWNKHKSKWQADIRIGGKKKNIGRFRSEIEAFNSYYHTVKNIGEDVSVLDSYLIEPSGSFLMGLINCHQE